MPKKLNKNLLVSYSSATNGNLPKDFIKDSDIRVISTTKQAPKLSQRFDKDLKCILLIVINLSKSS
ncbi:hypothetical protein [Helicobacter macacae]|uniref:hypothetical protein n=1 Tax=Helicobacter macacae TaxID=398626 RepID=UPI00165283B1|nr:hypothetical protein [Helicobacter macacae]